MKRICLGMAFTIVALMSGTQTASAQGWLDRLGSAASSLLGGNGNETVDKLADVASMLLGNDSLSVNRLKGTWVYSEPCVAFESENVLTNIGGVAASSKLESTLEGLLGKVGFTAGQLQLTLNADSTGVITSRGKDYSFQWRIEKTDIVLQFQVTKKEVRMNAKRTATSLQLSLKADKLLTLISTISEKAASVNSTAQGINAMVKNVKGMYIGLKFTPKKAQ